MSSKKSRKQPKKMVPGGPPAWVKWVAAGAVVAAVIGAFVYVEHARSADAERDAERDRLRREREEAEEREREQARIERLLAESEELMPEGLEGAALGMTKDELRARREGVTVRLGAGEPGLTFLEERLPNGAQVVYGFSDETGTMTQVQVMSILPNGEAVAPHLTSMVDHYGPFNGVFDCPDTGGVATRRFTWSRQEISIADIFLVYGGRISLTLYIAPTTRIAESLRRAQCRPVTLEQLDDFPVNSMEQIRQAQAEGGETMPTPIGGQPGGR